MDISIGSLVAAPIQPNIGAEISGIDLTQPISPAQADDLRAALLRYQVIILRDQRIDRAQHRAFASIFARNPDEPFFYSDTQARPIEGHREILNVYADGVTRTAADIWHTDGSWAECPPEISVLRSTGIMPSLGGDTCFASAGDAYDGLPDALKARIDGLRALHWKGFAQKAGGYGGLADGKRMEEAKQAFPPVAHPMVRIHPETGRRTLFVNAVYTGEVVGMDQAESDALLALLFNEVQKPDYQMRLRWTPHAIAVWDNRAVQHAATGNYSEPRMLERITTAGYGSVLGRGDVDAPVAAVG